MMKRPGLGLGALLCLSCFCRAPEIFADAHYDYLCKDVKRPLFFVQSVSDDGSRTLRTNRDGATGSHFFLPKPKHVKRIFVVGESAAQILKRGNDGDALSRFLRAASPQWRPEHINCGMGAYNSNRIAAVSEEVLGYEPDALVVLSGNNESPGFEPCPDVLTWIRYKWAEFTGWEASGTAVHEANLRRMARSAKKRGIPIVLCTLPVNLRDYVPWGGAPVSSPLFVSALAAMEKAKYAEAAASLNEALEHDQRNPFLHYFMGRCLERSGNIAEARVHYQLSVETDPYQERCSTKRNEMIRQVAAEEGAILADLEAAFEAVAAGGLVGDGLIADGVHWHARYNQLAACVIGDSLFHGNSGPIAARMCAKARHPASSSESVGEETKMILRYGLRYLDRWAGENPDGDILELGIEMLSRVNARDGALLPRIAESRSSLAGVVASNFWTGDINGNINRWRPVFLQHLAEMYRREGDAAAATRYLNEAVRLAPDRYMMRLYRGLAYASAGQKSLAAADFESLMPYKKKHPEIAYFP